MKKILLLLLLLPLTILGQTTKVSDLPTVTTGLGGDFLIKNDSAGGTKKISIGNFKTTYFSTLPTYSISASIPITFSLGVIGVDTSILATQYDLSLKQDNLTFTTPLTNSSNTVTIAQSTSVNSGYLSNTDWTTFNSKQNALTSGTGVTISTNTISIGQSVGITDNVSFRSVYADSLFNKSSTLLIGTKTANDVQFYRNNTLVYSITGSGLNFNNNNLTNVNTISTKGLTADATTTGTLTATTYKGVPYQFYLACTDETTAITATDTNSITIYAPFNFTVTSVFGMLRDAQSSGSTFTFDIKKNGTSIFGTLPTIDNTEFTTLTAATAAVLSTTTFAAGDRIVVYKQQVGTGGKGFKVAINYTR